MSILVIVESPAKASTIKGYLGSNYKVVASKGHVRDLAKSTLSVDIENNFTPHYINIRGKGDLIKELKKDSKVATKVFLATDADREGEAIAWHLSNVLGISPENALRITFNEITKSAIKDGIKSPRPINMDLVNSQQTRRILDRIVGYKLSPFLWEKVRSGLSAGRVQSVATRIIVEREQEIRRFVPEEYWNISANHTTKNGEKYSSKFYGTSESKINIHTHEEAETILSAIEGKEFIVTSVKKSLKKKNPLPPFETSSLQQDASRKLGFHTDRIMRVAQELYEGINIGSENGGVQGLITYMRTDSLRISTDAQQAAKELILEKYGEKYYPNTPRTYKSKGDAQDAHEAIRPSNMKNDPAKIKKYLSSDQYRLYKLIWDRFLASQMAAAEFDTVSAELTCDQYIFKTSGSTLRFAGFTAIYKEDSLDDSSTEDELAAGALPVLMQGDKPASTKITSDQHFTEPPARFNEGSLVKFLKEEGIGRPATYATIISTIIARGYVERQGKVLIPTLLGETTTRLMIENFPEVVDYHFTAQMENNLDEISDGKITMNSVLSEFYDRFEASLEKANVNVSKEQLPMEETGQICELCGSKMVVKTGRYGKFIACPNYPTCKNTKPYLEEGTKQQESTEIVSDQICEKCGAPMVLRSGRYGSFLACSNYPTCKTTLKLQPKIGVNCPLCGSPIVSKRAKGKMIFYSCSDYPKCQFSSWDKPTNEICPSCGKILYLKKGKDLLICKNESCHFTKTVDPNKDKLKSEENL